MVGVWRLVMEDVENKVTQRPGPDMHLGCGAKGPLETGKTKKICADCGETVEVNGNVIICPKCEGPLG